MTLNSLLMVYDDDYFSRKMEAMLDAFADRISKPRLSWTDKMLIYLGTCLLWVDWIQGKPIVSSITILT
jgi:hypothetical protein